MAKCIACGVPIAEGGPIHHCLSNRLAKMTEGQRFLLGMAIGGGLTVIGRWVYMGLIWGIR